MQTSPKLRELVPSPARHFSRQKRLLRRVPAPRYPRRSDRGFCARLPHVSRLQPRDLYAHPRDLLAEAVQHYGTHATVDTCLALLDGHQDYDLLPVPLTYLAGAHAISKLDRGNLEVRGQDHWPRVWAARGLRHVWLDYAEPGLVVAIADPSWRVREMAAKVVGQRRLTSAADRLLVLLDDEVVRVRVAGVRALGAVGGLEHLEQVEALRTDDAALRVAINGALRGLRLSDQRQ